MKLLRGNPGKRAVNQAEPKPALKVPPCPKELDPIAKTEWRRMGKELLRLGLITTVDRAAFAAYCQCWSDWIQAIEQIQIEGGVVKITGPKRLERLEARIDELERAVETARQAWLLARAQTHQTSEITNDIRDQINFTKQVLAVWNTASADDRRTVVDWRLDSILVKPGRKEGRRRKDEETVVVVALRSNPERPQVVRIVQAVEARAGIDAAKCDTAPSFRGRGTT